MCEGRNRNGCSGDRVSRDFVDYANYGMVGMTLKNGRKKKFHEVAIRNVIV